MSTPAADTVTRDKTPYIILKQEDGANGYVYSLAGDENAASSEAAIRAHFDNNTGATGGTYIAVPARSWKPVAVKVETTTTVKLS